MLVGRFKNMIIRKSRIPKFSCNFLCEVIDLKIKGDEFGFTLKEGSVH